MPSFLINFVILGATPEDEKALQTALAEANFYDTIVGSNNLKYSLPPSVFHYSGTMTKDQIFDSAKRIALRSGKRNRIIVTESAGFAWVGLDMVGRETAAGAASRAGTSPPAPEGTQPAE